MFTVTVNKEKVHICTNGERCVVLPEALCCIDGCKQFLMKHMNISKEEAVCLILESITE